MSGSHVTITGDVRGNGDVNFSGGSAAISGTISYGGSSNIDRGVSSAGVVHSAAEVASDLPWAITDFAPGGRYSSLEGYAFHADDLVLSKVNLAPGVHFVVGDVTIPGSSPVLAGVTIVATGRITISGNTTMTPAAAELPTMLAGGGSCWLNAIQLSGSHVAWTGVIAAPGGAVQISSAEVSGGRVVGGNVQMSGANITLG